ncbi:subtilisin-like protein [Colletotrichum falcatum]|nr:subtilisin-like protein [Colletotrichum falcatum]
MTSAAQPSVKTSQNMTRHGTKSTTELRTNRVTRLESQRTKARETLRQEISKALELSKDDKQKSAQSAEILEKALHWDRIKDLSKADSHVISANEHLALFYFDLKRYQQSAIIRRQVLAARQAAKPPDPGQIRRARQQLVASLIEIAGQDPLNARKINYEALHLATANMDSKANPDLEEDAKDVLQCCGRLLQRISIPPKEHASLLELRVRALMRRIEGRKTKVLLYDEYKDLTDTRLNLAYLYALKLNNLRRAEAVYESIKTHRATFSSGGLDLQQWAAELDERVHFTWKSILQNVKEARNSKQMERRKQSENTNSDSKRAESEPKPKSPSVPKFLCGKAWFQKRATSVLFDSNLPSSDSAIRQKSKERIGSIIELREELLVSGEHDKHPTKPPVRLTIIDTGIDDSHPFIKRKGWTPQRYGDNKPLFRDFKASNMVPIDEDGHGTFIAGIVLQLVPSVELSVARIGKTHATIRRESADVEIRVAEAIKHAMDVWQTDIISMSFGFDNPQSSELRDVVKKAQELDIILLCAAGNFGNMVTGPSFPARASRVLKIFACNHEGIVSDMSPPKGFEASDCFSILGCNIESTWPSNLRREAEKSGCKVTENRDGLWVSKSGTSFATPVAASLVAILIQFYNESRRHVHLKPGVKFKSIDVIRRVLDSLSMLPDRDGYKHLWPLVGREDHFNFNYSFPGESKKLFFARKLSDITLRV